MVVYSQITECMAWALAESGRRAGLAAEIVVEFQDECPADRWRNCGNLTHKVSRSIHAGGGDLRWLNKLAAISESPHAETVFLDSDMLVMRDMSHWWQELATDDLTFWNVRRRPADVSRETMVTNQLNPHPFCEHYGVEAVPVMLGGGHYYFRNTARGQAILQRIADIMVEAAENPDALYWKFAGKGNIVGDEPAASMAVVEFGVILPEPSPMAPAHRSAFLWPRGSGGWRWIWPGARPGIGATGRRPRSRRTWCISPITANTIRLTPPGWRSVGRGQFRAGPERADADRDGSSGQCRGASTVRKRPAPAGQPRLDHRESNHGSRKGHE